MGGRITSFLLLVVTLLSSQIVASAAQDAYPVQRCDRECDPRELNDFTHRRGSEPVETILYAHFEDILNVAPLNTQVPDERETDIAAGFLMPVIDINSGVCPASNTCADVHFRNNAFTMFSSPGLVEYMTEGWRTHQEPGLSAPLQIVGDEVRLYWYMSAATEPARQESGLATVGVMPRVGVYARIETGRFPFRGELIAESAQPSLVGMSDIITIPGQAPVYEFEVRLPLLQTEIPADQDGFVVYVSPYQVATGAQYGNQLATPHWRVHTGPRFPPRVVATIQDPIQSINSDIRNYEGETYLRWTVRPALGGYDLRDQDLRLTSTGPSPFPMEAARLIILRRSFDCDGHLKPVNATWAIDYTNFSLANGTYELTASIPNLQDTYLASHAFRFSVLNGIPQVHEELVRFGTGAETVPGPTPILVLVALFLGILWYRRP